MLIRLQKYLSERGVCSRRHAEEHITAGRIKVNGEVVTQLGTKVDPDRDVVEYSAEVVEAPQRLRYVILNKPYGIVTSCLQAGETTVKDLVNCKERIFPVGRLDKDSVGLVLMTNDGTLAYRLMHPKFLHEKEYVVDTEDAMTEGMLEKLSKGVKIEGVMTAPCKVRKVGPRRFRIVLREGRNRQIRKMVSKVGTEVVRLTRIRIENVRLGSLSAGAWRDLSFEEEYELFQRAGLVQRAEALKFAQRRNPMPAPVEQLSAWAEERKAKDEKRTFGLAPDYSGEEYTEDISSEDFEDGEEEAAVQFSPEEKEGYEGAFASRKRKEGVARGQRRKDLEIKDEFKSYRAREKDLDRSSEEEGEERPRSRFGRGRSCNGGAEGERRPRREGGFNGRREGFGRREEGFGRRPAQGFKRPARARNFEKDFDRPRRPYVRREEAEASGEERDRYQERYGMGRPARQFDRDSESSGERPRRPYAGRPGGAKQGSKGGFGGPRGGRSFGGSRGGRSFGSSRSGSKGGFGGSRGKGGFGKSKGGFKSREN